MFRHALVTGPDWAALCRQAVAALDPIPEPAGLGFIYLDSALTPHVDAILGYLREHTPVRHWVGSSCSGLIGTGNEHYETPGMSLLVTDLREEDSLLLPNIEEDATAVLLDSRPWRDRNMSFFGVVHGDPRNPRVPQLIPQLAQGMDGGFLVGGLSSAGEEALVQVADQRAEKGLSGVLFSASVPVITGLTQGCALIGPRHEVTTADGHIVARLDGRPALEVLKEDVGEELAKNLQRIGGHIFAALPVTGSDTGDYLVRNLLGMDPENGLIAVGDRLHPGMTLQFAKRDRDSASDDLVRMLHDVKSRLVGRPKGALYFSCLGRGRQLFGDDSAELTLVREVLGDVPLAGFYANGEISNNRLYGYTGVLTVFLEHQ